MGLPLRVLTPEEVLSLFREPVETTEGVWLLLEATTSKGELMYVVPADPGWLSTLPIARNPHRPAGRKNRRQRHDAGRKTVKG